MSSVNHDPSALESSESDIGLSPQAWFAKWQARLSQGRDLAAHFAYLNEALTHAAQPVDETADACADFEPLLEAYMDDLRGNAPIGEFYAPLLAHLNTCESCQTKFETLREWLTPTWSISSLSRQVQHVSGLLIEFAPAYLVSLFQRPTPLVTRSLDTPTTTQNILSDYTTIDQRVWSLNIELNAPQNDVEHVTLCADCVTDEEAPLQITLHWAQQTHIQAADEAGHVCFADLPVVVLQQPNPKVSLEVLIRSAPNARMIQ